MSPAKKTRATKKTGSKKKTGKTTTKKTSKKKKIEKKTIKKKTAKTTAKKAPAKKVAKKTPAAKKKSTTKSKSAGTSGVKVPKYGVRPASRDDAVESKPVPPLSKRIGKRDLGAIRKQLLQRRRDLLGSIDSIEAEYLGTKENVTTKGGDEADQATSALTADLSLRLAESESKVLKEVNHAIGKLEDGTYGVCEVTGQPIETRRLLAMPWARLSLDAQRQVEQQQISFDEARGWVSADEF